MQETVRAAAVQFAPVRSNHEATIANVCEYVRRAASEEVQLVVFPECTIPMYPERPSSESTEVRLRYWEALVEHSVEIPGPVTAALARAASEGSIHVVAGVNERVMGPGGPRLFNTAVLFGPDGNIVGRHRKTTPIGFERYYHDPGQADDVAVFSTQLGQIGIGICYENLHPLYRYSLLSQGEEIHCAVWVPIAADKDLVAVSARNHAAEGGVFVVAAGQVSDEPDTSGIGTHDESVIGGSVIAAPGGHVLAGPTFGREIMIQATLERRLITRAHWDFHLMGKERRPDLFSFSVTPKGGEA